MSKGLNCFQRRLIQMRHNLDVMKNSHRAIFVLALDKMKKTQSHFFYYCKIHSLIFNYPKRTHK